MSEVTSPIMTDATGQTMNTKLDAINTTLGQIKNLLTTPSDAEDITYDNTQSGMTATDVQGAVDELNASLVNFGNKTAVVSGTFNANTGAYSALINYPSGFNFNNTLVVSLNYASSDSTKRYYGEGSADSSFQRCFVRLQTTGIDVYNTSSSLKGLNFSVILMRIDI